MLERKIQWLLKEKYANNPTEDFKRDIERLRKGEPADYVIGFVEFLGCKIDLSEKPLIPRPETEYWAGEAIKDLKSPGLRILDIFSGSGCIGIAALKHIKDSKADFGDKDERFIRQIKINLKINNIPGSRYKVIQSDIFKNIRNKYDCIFSNPPYIPSSRRHRIQESVLKFEPGAALFGGKDGLLYIRKFLKDARRFLKKNGVIYMEFDSMQKKEIEKMLKRDYQFYKDQFKRWRYLRVAKN